MNKIPVEGHSHLVRASDTGAILNINKSAIIDARNRKKNKLAEKEEYEKLKSDVDDIKSILTKILEKMNDTILY